MSPVRLWLFSCYLHRHGLTWAARLVKSIVFVVYSAALPYECRVSRDIVLWHHGLGVVIHPNTVIEAEVQIGHGVTIAAGVQGPIGDRPVVISKGAKLGAGCYVGARSGEGLRIGEGSYVGAHAIVTRDVPASAVMFGGRAQAYERGHFSNVEVGGE